MNPREEKAKDFANKCKNGWGNSDKAARKGIRRFKRGSYRHSRRLDKIQLGETISVDGEGALPPPPVYRRKSADTSMGEEFLRKAQRRIRQILPCGTDDALVNSFEDYCVRKGIQRQKAAGWARYLRGELTSGVIPPNAMTLEDAADLEGALREFSRDEITTSEQAAP